MELQMADQMDTCRCPAHIQLSWGFPGSAAARLESSQPAPHPEATSGFMPDALMNSSQAPRKHSASPSSLLSCSDILKPVDEKTS